MRTITPEGYYLIADTAFPRGTKSIEGKIKAPLKDKERLPRNPEERQSKLRFTRQLVSCRQAAEWGMRTLQGSFGRLRLPLDIGKPEARLELLEVCVRLQNLRTNLVGINQIRNTFEPLWKDGDDLWEDFSDSLFKDIQGNDRVSRFHIEARRVE